MIEVDGKKIKITIGDVGNIIVFVHADDMGVSGYETAEHMTDSRALLDRVREVRGKASQMVGMCEDWRKVDEQAPFLPMLAVIQKPPQDKPEAHISSRLFLDNMCHPSMAGTGSVCHAAMSRTAGTLVYDIVGKKARAANVFNISHPPAFSTLSFIRTSRRLMDGKVYVPKEIFEPATNGINGINGHH